MLLSEAVFSVHRERIMYITHTVKEGSFFCTISTPLQLMSHRYELLTREAFVAAAGDTTPAFKVLHFGMWLLFSCWLRRLLRRSPLRSITPTRSFFRSCRSVILATGNIACYTKAKRGLHLGLRLPTATVNHTRYTLHLRLAYLKRTGYTSPRQRHLIFQRDGYGTLHPVPVG